MITTFPILSLSAFIYTSEKLGDFRFNIFCLCAKVYLLVIIKNTFFFNLCYFFQTQNLHRLHLLLNTYQKTSLLNTRHAFKIFAISYDLREREKKSLLSRFFNQHIISLPTKYILISSLYQGFHFSSIVKTIPPFYELGAHSVQWFNGKNYEFKKKV